MHHSILNQLPLVSLTGWWIMFAIKRKSLFAGDCAGLLYHLSLLPLVEFLPGGLAVKFAGYLWLLMDALIDVISINRIGHSIVWALRMGVHLFASIWITGTSFMLSGPMHYIGIPLGVGLAVHAIFCANMARSKIILKIFVVPLMSAWLLAMYGYFFMNPI